MSKQKFKLTIPIADEQTFKLMQNAHGAVNKFSHKGTPVISFDNWITNIVVRESYEIIKQVMDFNKKADEERLAKGAAATDADVSGAAVGDSAETEATATAGSVTTEDSGGDAG